MKSNGIAIRDKELHAFASLVTQKGKPLSFVECANSIVKRRFSQPHTACHASNIVP